MPRQGHAAALFCHTCKDALACAVPQMSACGQTITNALFTDVLHAVSCKCLQPGAMIVPQTQALTCFLMHNTSFTCPCRYQVAP